MTFCAWSLEERANEGPCGPSASLISECSRTESSSLKSVFVSDCAQPIQEEHESSSTPSLALAGAGSVHAGSIPSDSYGLATAAINLCSGS